MNKIHYASLGIAGFYAVNLLSQISTLFGFQTELRLLIFCVVALVLMGALVGLFFSEEVAMQSKMAAVKDYFIYVLGAVALIVLGFSI